MENSKILMIHLPSELKRELKFYCSLNGTSMTRFVTKIIKEGLDKEARTTETFKPKWYWSKKKRKIELEKLGVIKS